MPQLIMPTILVFEAEPLARASLAELFRAENSIVHTAANIDEAMFYLDNNAHIDAVLIDLYAPFWDRFMRQIRRTMPNAVIVAMGSFDTDVEATRAQGLGVDAHVEKPLLFSELHERLLDLLRKRR